MAENKKALRYRNKQKKTLELLNQQFAGLQKEPTSKDTLNKRKMKRSAHDPSEIYALEDSQEDELQFHDESDPKFRKDKSREWFEPFSTERVYDKSSYESITDEDKNEFENGMDPGENLDKEKEEDKELNISNEEDQSIQDVSGEIDAMLENNDPLEQHAHILIPDELKDFLFVEDCSKFDVKTYMPTKMQEDILQSIVTARRIATAMKEKNGLSYPNTTLLYGPPGTGKTTLGRYVAYRMGMDFVYLDFSKIIDGIFGSTSRNISSIFQYMIDKECIFMLDELDAVAVKRGNESEATGGELGRITITIMQQFDYYRRHDSQAIIIAATNRADRIDPALRSRFSIEHEIKEMTVSEKVQYIKRFLGRHDIPYDERNIKEYSSRNSLLPTRNVESDIIRCLVEYYKHEEKVPYYLNHVAKGREF